jgi:hypothetical protein
MAHLFSEAPGGFKSWRETEALVEKAGRGPEMDTAS